MQSATIMWEHVETLFENLRQLMRKSGGARSGSFSIPWTAACMSKKGSRLDATLGYQNLAYDIERCKLKFATRFVLHAIQVL